MTSAASRRVGPVAVERRRAKVTTDIAPWACRCPAAWSSGGPAAATPAAAATATRRSSTGCLTWHLRQAWAPLTFTDENRPEAADPVAPAQRSHGADAKAATKRPPTTSQPAASPPYWATSPR